MGYVHMKINFISDQQSIEASPGTEFLRLYELNPLLPLKFGCRKGICGKCAINVVEGMDNLTKCSEEEKATLAKKELSSSHRLACQCAINGSIAIDPIK